MSLSRDRLAAVYLSDGNHDSLTHVSIVALALAHERPIDIHLVQSNYSNEAPPSVSALVAARRHRLVLHSVKTRDRGIETDGHLTPTTCAKFEAVDAVVADYAGLLYLDNDVLSMRAFDIARMIPRRHAVAAVPDLSVSTGLDDPAFFENCRRNGLVPRYFNAGVLAIDSERWVSDDLSRRYDVVLAWHQRHCPYRDLAGCGGVDQCALNLLLNGAWDVLPIACNAQKSAFQTVFWSQAVLRHYTGAEKFLPVHGYRADAREWRLLAQIDRLCPDLQLRLPKAYTSLPYHLNRARRALQRSRIEKLIAERLTYAPASCDTPLASEPTVPPEESPSSSRLTAAG